MLGFEDLNYCISEIFFSTPETSHLCRVDLESYGDRVTSGVISISRDSVVRRVDDDNVVRLRTEDGVHERMVVG